MKEKRDDLSFFNVDFETAKKLKSLGFNETTTAFWDIKINDFDSRAKPTLYGGKEEKLYNQYQPLTYAAPTRAEVMEWFRRVHNYYIYITPRFEGFDGTQYYCYYSIFKKGAKESCDIDGDGCYGYREAEERAIEEVIQLLQKA